MRGKSVLIMYHREGQKLRRRNFPKGYAEMLEKQHNQLVCGLQEMYQRLRKADLWDGEALDESSGRPLTHDILAALNFLEPNENGSDEEFIEQPQSSPMLEAAEEGVESTAVDSRQETLQSTPPMFVDPTLSVHAISSRSASVDLSPTTPRPFQLPGQSKLQQHDLQKPSRQLYPVISPPMQLDGLWDDPLFCFDASGMPLSNSSSGSLDNNSWGLQVPALMPPLVPGLSGNDTSSHRRTASVPGSSLNNNWPGNSVGFDSTDFMTDFHQLSPREFKLHLPMKAGRLSQIGV